MEFVFEETPWEQAISALQPGDTISALRCLNLLEELSQDDAAEALLMLEEKGIGLDISDLPKGIFSGEAALRLRQEQQLAEKGQLLEGLEGNDPLRLYLEEIAALPAFGDAEALARQYAAGDETAAQKLANLSLSRVVQRACALTGRGVLLLDLIQEGSVGLWQGILNYTDGDYVNHINWWIDQYLCKAVLLQALESGVGQRMRQGMEDYRDMDQRLLAELGRNPTLEEVAEAIHASADEAAVYASMLSQARARQQIEQLRGPREETADDTQAVENTAYFQTRQRILELLSGLSQQEQKLLTLRFGLEGGLPKSPQETGDALGLTAEEVVTLEANALLKLRQQEQ